MHNTLSTRTRQLCLGVLVACLGIVGHAQQKSASLTGTWKLDVKTPEWTSKPILTLEHASNKLTGHYSSKNFGEHDIEKSAVNNRQFSFSFDVSNGHHGYQTIHYQGSLTEKDTLDGTVDAGAWGKGTFTAVRSAVTK